MMPPDAWQAIGVSVAALLGGGGPVAVWLAIRAKSRGEDVPKVVAADAIAEAAVTNSTLGAHWEDLASKLEERIDRQDKKISELEKKQADAWAMIRAQNDYIFVLRQHIFEGRKPPPPDPTSPLLADFARPSDQK